MDNDTSPSLIFDSAVRSTRNARMTKWRNARATTPSDYSVTATSDFVGAAVVVLFRTALWSMEQWCSLTKYDIGITWHTIMFAFVSKGGCCVLCYWYLTL